MFEHHTRPLISKKAYLIRLGKNLLAAVLLVGLALGIGVVGYHDVAELS